MAAARAQAETLPQRARRRDARAGDWDDVRRGARGRLQHACRPRDPARLGTRRAPLDELRRGLAVFGLGSLAEHRRGAPAEVVALAEARVGGAGPARDFAEADRLRDEIAARGWEVRDVAGGLRARPARVTRDLVYGRNAVREALRGRRAVLEVWASERAAATLDWLGEGPRRRCGGSAS